MSNPPCFQTPIRPAGLAGALVAALALGASLARADWPPRDPNVRTFFVQQPDVSTNGLDVLASPHQPGTPEQVVLADDWICRGPGPVTDIHLWGSWLNGLADPEVTFWLGIWTDAPATPDAPNRPDQLVWSQEFRPGEYRARVWRSGVLEQFLEPVVPALMGVDRQIWQYNFYLRNPFHQEGRPEHPVIYWLSVMARPTLAGRLFGWKTTTDHFNDAAVFAVVPGTWPPAGLPPWQVLRNPTGRSLELAFALTTSQSWAVNKTFYNRTPSVVGNTRVRLPGSMPIADHFDGPTAGPWSFGWEWGLGDTTVLDWAAPPQGGLPPGQCVHLGYGGPGALPPFLNWGWWEPLTQTWLGDVAQVNVGWPRPLPATPYLIGFTNALPLPAPPPPPWPPFTNFLSIDSLTVEYHTNTVPLAALNHEAARSPVASVTVPIVPGSYILPPGAAVQIQVPQPPPPGATYAVVIVQANPLGDFGLPMPELGSTDWLLLPTTLPEPAPPTPQPTLLPARLGQGEITLFWTTVPGGIYQVQSRASLGGGDAWSEVTGNVVAAQATAEKTVPMSGVTAFYRVAVVSP